MPRRIKRNFTDKIVPVILSLPLGLLSAVFLRFALNVNIVYRDFLAEQSEKLQAIFLNEGIAALINTSAVVAGIGFLLFFISFLVTLAFKKNFSLSLIRKSYAVFYLFALAYVFMIFRITGIVLENSLQLNGLNQDSLSIFYLRFEMLFNTMLVAVVVAVLYLVSLRRRVIAVYTGFYSDVPASGDLIFENIRTHGKDPLFRKSLLTSSFMHLAIIILPLIMTRVGCVRPYEVPKGDDPVVQLVQVVQPKKPPKKRHVLNPKAAISFNIPDLEDSELLKDVEQVTQMQHNADPTSVHAAKTTGRKSGWPDGVEDAVFRFIRLQYSGSGWDDGMDPVARSDINFLEEFRRATGFRVEKQSESHPISSLARYPPGKAPPFVFLTGDGYIRVSGRDMDILRRYLTDGSMLFVDGSSLTFDRSFRSFVHALFPGEDLRVISDDDPIFQTPFVFPHGAPPLWHHGGSRALGIRRGNRWMVFYHPGDLHDAWKTGHSGVRPEIARQAYQLGINVVFHAFTHYMDATRKYRK